MKIRVRNGKVKLPNEKERKLKKPVHVIDVSLPDYLYDVSAADIRKTLQIQLEKIKKVELKIEPVDLKYKELVE